MNNHTFFLLNPSHNSFCTEEQKNKRLSAIRHVCRNALLAIIKRLGVTPGPISTLQKDIQISLGISFTCLLFKTYVTNGTLVYVLMS